MLIGYSVLANTLMGSDIMTGNYDEHLTTCKNVQSSLIAQRPFRSWPVLKGNANLKHIVLQSKELNKL